MNYFDDSAIDAAVVAAKGTEGSERQAAIDEVWTRSAEAGYYAGLYTPTATYGVNPSVVWTPRADGLFLLDQASVN